MLLLNRREGERIVIEGTDGAAVEIVVGKIGGNRVQIGVIAPPRLLVRRKELPRIRVVASEAGDPG
jgi:carbon storage regulator CsrA